MSKPEQNDASSSAPAPADASTAVAAAAAPAPATDPGAFAFQSLYRIDPPVDDKNPENPRDVDPSNPVRSVPTKKANQAYLVHKRYVEKQRQERREKRIAQGLDPDVDDDAAGGQGGEPGAGSVCFERVVKAMFYGFLLWVAAGLFVTGSPLWGYKGKWIRLRTYFPPQQRLFTPAELQLYAGRATDRPIYLAVMGDVYDVTSNPRIYGPGGSYSFFAGRDASRAYITGCFENESQLTHDLRGLSDEDMSHVLLWKKFFDEHDSYFKVGRVSLPLIEANAPIPEKCDPTKAGKM
ncbi:hypothetical protein A4X09_0g2500 [Tilletia walkeri]|uniref:Cytochrome b5 heme-binding domain-containing protein n=1 Tax=Tilletia walkeri TaxID=117179 RepID=A0A8X7ND76_9BASI|nr:hypothetical protein A4X09_0g2500 [Tilletia walkeri]